MSEPHICPECARVFNWGADADSAIVEKEGKNWHSCRENAHWKLTFHVKQEHPDSGFVCARRGESVTIRGRDDSKDFWSTRDGHRSCSYCGSISPDELFAAIEAGAEIGPTDKSYKVYVDLPHPESGQPCVVSSANFKFAVDAIEVTEENIGTLPLDSYQRANYLGHWVQISKRGPAAHAKFYFQHLSVEQQQRFIDLLNAKKINIGMPGYFYARPFFIAPPASAVAAE